MTDPKEQIKKTKKRSPNYPSISLPVALERLQKFYDEYNLHEVPISMVHELWGYEKLSGATKQTVAALNYFGLVTVTGTGDSRKIQVSDTGYKILEESPDHKKLLVDALKNPEIYNKLLEKYKNTGIPHDNILKNYLVWDIGFNKNYVDYFIADFKESVEFANPNLQSIIETEEVEEAEETEEIEEGEMQRTKFPNQGKPKDNQKQKFTFTIPSGTDVATFSIPVDIDPNSFYVFKNVFINALESFEDMFVKPSKHNSKNEENNNEQ